MMCDIVHGAKHAVRDRLLRAFGTLARELKRHTKSRRKRSSTELESISLLERIRPRPHGGGPGATKGERKSSFLRPAERR
jgi:hypothetical protein